jgi:hypothetical protein
MMRIDEKSGQIRWYPCCHDGIGCNVGRHSVSVLAYDEGGQHDIQNFTIDVKASEPELRFTEPTGSKITAKVGETVLVRLYVGYTASSLDKVTFELSHKISPDNNGIVVTSSTENEWTDAGCTSFFPVYNVTGKKAGMYEITTTMKVRENGCSAQATTVVIVE